MLPEREQPYVDSQQRLRDFVLEFVADVFAFVLLSGQKPVRQLAQPFLQVERFLQAFVVQLSTFFVGRLHRLALDHSLSQLSIRVGEFCRTMAERFRELAHVEGGLGGGALGLLDCGICFLEKNLGALCHGCSRSVQTVRLHEAGERLLMNSGQVQGFQPGSHRLASQSQRGLQALMRACFQMFLECRRISVGKLDGFIFHGVSTERGISRRACLVFHGFLRCMPTCSGSARLSVR